MTLLERIQELSRLAGELAEKAEELHAEIDDAINDPSWLLPEEIIKNKNESENNSTEDGQGEEGGES